MEETDNIEISSALLQKLAAEPNPIEGLLGTLIREKLLEHTVRGE